MSDNWKQQNKRYVLLTLDQQEEVLDGYQGDLAVEIDQGGLYSRNPTVHKWKVTYRLLVLRELASWRFCDLMKQALYLERGHFHAGESILIRSSLETLALLIFCSQKMENVMKSGDGFHQLSKKTTDLLMGSKGQQTNYKSINVNDFLKAASKDYPEIRRAYDELSETTHPNFDGLFRRYSTISKNGTVTKFSNQSSEIYKNAQPSLISLILVIFEMEYNDRWITAFKGFETWIVENDQKLENTK